MALYASIGPELIQFDVDVEAAALSERSRISLPGNVQYAWPHRSGAVLYVATSAPAHHLLALRIDAGGGLAALGEPVALPSRPIHLSTDVPSEYILIAFNDPSAVRVHRIGHDGAPGTEVRQPEAVDAGIFAHQVRVSPDNRRAIVVARGNAATPARPEEPGALKVYDYRDGRLTNPLTVGPPSGFGPRHLDFHPSRPWAYVSVELQDEIAQLSLGEGRGGMDLRCRASTLSAPGRGQQGAGAIHVHPNGRFVYVSNRTGGAAEAEAGEDGIAVFEIDSTTGAPRAIQHVATRGVHPRCFHVDPTGRLLVAQHNRPALVRDDDGVRRVPAGLSLFRIGPDGRLDFVRYDAIEVGDRSMFWMRMVSPTVR